MDQRAQPGGNQAKLPSGLHGYAAWLFQTSPSYRALWTELQRSKASTAMVQRAKESTAFFDASGKDFHGEKMLKYAQWARDVLPVMAPDVFKRAGAAGSAEPPRFMDLGAAPGGLSCFLHGDLRWSGVAVSLSVAAGGMPMMYQGVKISSSGTAVTSSRPASSIKSPFTAAKLLRAANAKAADKSAATGPAFAARDGDIRADELSVMAGEAPDVTPQSCSFVMAGAVQDQSQRDEAGLSAETMAELFEEQLRQRVAFLTDQLRWAHKALRRDGTATLMLVMGPAECASTSVVAGILASLAAEPKRVRILTTMHSDKAPVYILAPGLNVCDVATDVDEVGTFEAAWRDLLDPARIVAKTQAINAGIEDQIKQRRAAEDDEQAAAVDDGALTTPFALPSHLMEDLESTFRDREGRVKQQRRRAEERADKAYAQRA
jgi:hypothetical protein